MSSRIRFAAARNVFEAFTDLSYAVAPPVDDSAPLDYARALLASPRPTDSIVFIAHLLPRREAVWWAIQCVRAMPGTKADDEALRAAEAWVRAPEEDNRNAALAIASAADQRAPTTWLAFAAAWSGGSTTPADQKPMPAPLSACAKAAHIAVIVAASAGDPLGVVQRITACAEAGIRFADGGEASVTAPKASPAKARATALR
jgi:Family of unknown function (DUF6931)